MTHFSQRLRRITAILLSTALGLALVLTSAAPSTAEIPSAPNGVVLVQFEESFLQTGGQYQVQLNQRRSVSSPFSYTARNSTSLSTATQSTVTITTPVGDNFFLNVYDVGEGSYDKFSGNIDSFASESEPESFDHNSIPVFSVKPGFTTTVSFPSGEIVSVEDKTVPTNEKANLNVEAILPQGLLSVDADVAFQLYELVVDQAGQVPTSISLSGAPQTNDFNSARFQGLDPNKRYTVGVAGRHLVTSIGHKDNVVSDLSAVEELTQTQIDSIVPVTLTANMLTSLQYEVSETFSALPQLTVQVNVPAGVDPANLTMDVFEGAIGSAPAVYTQRLSRTSKNVVVPRETLDAQTNYTIRVSGLDIIATYSGNGTVKANAATISMTPGEQKTYTISPVALDYTSASVEVYSPADRAATVVLAELNPTTLMPTNDPGTSAFGERTGDLYNFRIRDVSKTYGLIFFESKQMALTDFMFSTGTNNGNDIDDELAKVQFGTELGIWSMAEMDTDTGIPVGFAIKPRTFAAGSHTEIPTISVGGVKEPSQRLRTLTKPALSGSAKIGATLTASTGTWTPAPQSITYQWFANGVLIAGQNKSTLFTVPAQSGAKITARATASKRGFASTTVETNAISLPSVGTIKPSTPAVTSLQAIKKPVISGTAKVNNTLKAVPAQWNAAGTAVSYQWYVGGKAVKGATAGSFKLPANAVGKTVQVIAKGKNKSFTATTQSAKTTKVAKSTATVSGKLAKTSLKKNKSTSIRVKIVTPGVSKPTGTVSVKIGKKTVKASLKAAHKGSIKVSLKGSVLNIGKKQKVTVSFKPSGTAAKSSSVPKAKSTGTLTVVR